MVAVSLTFEGDSLSADEGLDGEFRRRSPRSICLDRRRRIESKTKAALMNSSVKSSSRARMASKRAFQGVKTASGVVLGPKLKGVISSRRAWSSSTSCLFASGRAW